MLDQAKATQQDHKGGSAESAAFFRAALEEIGETHAGLARLLQRNGDDRQPATILRHIQRMATGEARVSGEMRVILTFLRNGRRRHEEKAVRSPWDLQDPAMPTLRTQDGFLAVLHPKSMGRWQVTVRFEPNGYSHPYPAWQPSLAAAQARATDIIDELRWNPPWKTAAA